MATKAKPDTLAGAMSAAFAEIEAATKSANNPHFKSKYADLGAVIDAVKPALIAHDLFFTQRCHPCEDGVSVETVLHHMAGEKESLGILFVPANKKDAQGFGSALTYARRYGLMTAFGVPAEDDDGNAAARTTQRSSGPPANDANGNGHGKEDTGPFPPGPAKNKTELKTMMRELWREVEGCGDMGELDALLMAKPNVALVNQLLKALPEWWEGRQTGNMPFDGLETVIQRKRDELNIAAANQSHPFAGG